MPEENQPRPGAQPEGGQPSQENPTPPQPEGGQVDPTAEAAARVDEAKTAEEARDALNREDKSNEGDTGSTTTYKPKETSTPAGQSQDSGTRNEGFRPTNEPPTVEDKILTNEAYLENLQAQRDKLKSTPANELPYPGTNHERFLSDEDAEAWRQQELQKLNKEISEAGSETDLLKKRQSPERINEINEKIKNGTATEADFKEKEEITEKGRELTKEEEFQHLKEKTDLTKEEQEKYLDLKEQINQEKISDLDMAWKEKAARGEDPGEELVTYINKLNELNGDEPLTDRETTDLKGFLKDVYEGGIDLPGFEKSKVRDRFKELGKLEAQIVALKETINSMKKSEGEMKAAAHNAEVDYLREKDPQERMRKLTDWRQKALRLEGYQMAINGQAARGREMTIRRRRAAGYIHRQLGTRGLRGNISFGLATFGYELSDTFQDVAVDPVKNRFS